MYIMLINKFLTKSNCRILGLLTHKIKYCAYNFPKQLNSIKLSTEDIAFRGNNFSINIFKVKTTIAKTVVF